MVWVSPLGFGSVRHSLHTWTGPRYLPLHSVAWTGLAAHTHRQACSPPWRLYSLSLFRFRLLVLHYQRAMHAMNAWSKWLNPHDCMPLSFIDRFSLSHYNGIVIRLLLWCLSLDDVVGFGFGEAIGQYLVQVSTLLAWERERDHSLPSVSSHRVSFCVSLGTQWLEEISHNATNNNHQLQEALLKSLVFLKLDEPSLSRVWVSELKDLGWFFWHGWSRPHHNDAISSLSWWWRWWVGDLEVWLGVWVDQWKHRTSNGIGVLYWHTHTHWFVFSESKSSNNNNINITSTKPIKPSTTTKYKCPPSLIHSHPSLISSSIINNHQQLVWNDDPLSFGVLEVWVDWIGLMNRLNQSKIVFSVMMMIECDCKWWWWRTYSNNNNHNKPPRSWLVTLSQTLMDSNTQYVIPLSLSLDISRWNNNIQKRTMLMMITNIKIDLDLSFVSVIVLVPSTRFKQSSRSNNELCK